LFSRRRPNEVSRVQSKQSQVGDNFGTLLDTLNEGSVSSQAPSSSSSAASEASSAADAGTPPRPAVSLQTITHAVGKLAGVRATRVADLQAMLGMGFTEFGGLIMNLHQLGLVEISGEPGAETIALTAQGELLSHMS
jgi:hypothetical protein